MIACYATALREYRIDSESGVVYGKRGAPIGHVKHDGYLEIHSKKIGDVRLNRLIWMAVNGPIPKGMDVVNINEIKTDNRIGNLQLVTLSEIGLRNYKRGRRTAKGEANGRARLSEKDVLSIRSSSWSNEKLGEQYGVSESTVRDARSRKNWALVADAGASA